MSWYFDARNIRLPSLLLISSYHTLTSLLGGALGIGSELVRLLHSAGSSIFFGDILIPEGGSLASELSSTSKPGQVVKFLYTDAADHLSNLGLFDLAFKTCGRVDHAVSVAGINKEENIVDVNLDLESVRKVRIFPACSPFLKISIWFY